MYESFHPRPAHAPTRRAKERMLREHLIARGVVEPHTLEAMASVPREAFIPEALGELSYADRALPIACEQTISQPYIVGLMTQLAAVGPGDRVLEVGTGCGYQTAVLCATGAEVFSVEILPALSRSAAERLRALGYAPHLRVGDGHEGWPEQAPFDAIVVTAAPPHTPPALVAQLAPGGRLVLPVGEDEQTLCVVRRTETGPEVERITSVRFVPMTGGCGASFSPVDSFDIL